jgi:2'-hydroxyisoflavone reductase
LADCQAVTAAEVSPVWVDTDFVREHELVAGRDLPIWAAPDGDAGKAALTSGAAAYEKGLKVRPTRETARDTIRWWKTLPADRTATLKAGLKPEQEARLLAAWREG